MKRYFFVLLLLFYFSFLKNTEIKIQNVKLETKENQICLNEQCKINKHIDIEKLLNKKILLIVFANNSEQIALLLPDVFAIQDCYKNKENFMLTKEKFRPQSARLYIISDSDESNAIMVL